MRYVEAGGRRLSVIGLGTWQFGSAEWGYGRAYALGEALAIARRAVELGINVVDTAELYGFGASERIVGRALHGVREKAFIATKLLPLLPLPRIVESRARASARRLGVERLDLYQLHWSNPVVPVASAMAGMARVLDAGLAEHAGVSNHSLQQWQAAEAALGRPVLSNQVLYNLLERQAEHAILPWAAASHRVVMAYSPLAQGLLSARYGRDRRPGGMRSWSAAFSPENLERVKPVLDALAAIAARHDATPAQVALAWTVRLGPVVAIPGASSVAQLEANAAAADLVLDEDDDGRLDEASRSYAPYRRSALQSLSAAGRALAAKAGRSS